MTPQEFKAARLKLGLTAAQLCRCLEVDLRTVYRYERAEIPIGRPIALLLSLALTQEAARAALLSPLAYPPPPEPAPSRRAPGRRASRSPGGAPASRDSGA
jgi:transcriptional regulator with XRE-family HTH domain